MIHAFRFKKNKLCRINLNKTESLSESIWIDLINPNNNERNRVQCELKHDLVTKPELEDIEASARFFENKYGLHIHSFFLYSDIEDRIGNTTVAFSIQNKKLFSLRERELSAFRLYRMRFRNKTMNNKGNAYKILLDLFEIKIEQLADKIENICSDLELLSLVIMNNHSYKKKYDDALSTLAELEDVSWKVRLCLMDTQRALKFLIRKTQLPLNQLGQAKEVLRDIDSLLPHNESLFQKVNFLLQAAMGFINIEQNKIIKIFSVVSVIFLPPTLVASSYGMNFEFMPELKWIFGYPCAIILMILTGLAPYFYFKKKKWL